MSAPATVREPCAPADVAEWEAGWDAGWLAGEGDREPEGTDDFVFGWYCGCYDFRHWKAGWDDFHAGQPMPRFDPELPDTAELWKEGYSAAFLASAKEVQP